MAMSGDATGPIIMTACCAPTAATGGRGLFDALNQRRGLSIGMHDEQPIVIAGTRPTRNVPSGSGARLCLCRMFIVGIVPSLSATPFMAGGKA